MINILYVIGDKMNRAGAETMIMNYYRNMDKKKYKFFFAVHSTDEGDYDTEIIKLGGKIFAIPRRIHIIKNILAIKTIIDKNNIQIVHAHDDMACGLAMYAAYLSRVPVRISHSHNTEFQTKNTIKKQINKCFRAMIMKYGNEYMACSEKAGIFLFGDKKFTTINNAIDISKFEYNLKIREKRRLELDFCNDTIVILSVARFNYQKNHKFLISIFSELCKINKNYVLILVGEGEEKNNIEEMVYRLHLNDKVFFFGKRDDVDQLMSMSDVFLMPSLFEGLPVVGVEAQVSGLLCFFSDIVTKEVDIIPGTTYLSLNENANKWASCINEHINNHDFDRAKGGEFARKKGFDIKHESEKLSRMYEFFLKKIYTS